MAAPPPWTGGGPLGHSTFGAYWDDISKDNLGGNYIGVMADFSINGEPPNHLLQSVTNKDPHTSAMGYLFLVQPPYQARIQTIRNRRMHFLPWPDVLYTDDSILAGPNEGDINALIKKMGKSLIKTTITES